MADYFTIKKYNMWKNGKGAFIVFDERPETFYIFGNKALEAGQKCLITVSDIACGDLKGSKRINTIIVDNPTQKTLLADSAIVQAQKSTGAVLKTPVAPDPEKNNEFLMHECVAKQAEKIVELTNVVAKLMLRQDQAEKIAREQEQKLRILQDKVGVSFV